MNVTQLTAYRDGIIAMIEESERKALECDWSTDLVRYHRMRIDHLLDHLDQVEEQLRHAEPSSLEQMVYDHDMKRIGE